MFLSGKAALAEYDTAHISAAERLFGRGGVGTREPRGRMIFASDASMGYSSILFYLCVQVEGYSTLPFCLSTEDDYLNIVSLFQQRLRDRGYSRDYIQITQLQQASRSTYLREMFVHKKKTGTKPILTITTPTKGPNINWKEALMVPEDVLSIDEYKMAYPTFPTRVTLGRKHAKNIARSLVTNKYPQT